MSSPLPHAESPPVLSGSSGFTAPVAKSPPSEIARLQTSFRRLLLVLSAIGVAAGVGVGLALAWDTTASPRLLLLGALGGAIGGVLSAGVSAMDRYSNGLELLDGQKVPADAAPPAKPTGRFSVRMLPQFYFRPMLGAGMGMIAFAGLVAGVLFSTRTTSPAALVPESVLFFALLSGLFAKTLIERLKTGFKAMVGASDK